MNCKHRPERLATGNFIQRAMARWHARRCPSCRRSWELIERLRQEMSAADPLSDVQRPLWSRAMGLEPVRAERHVVAAGPIAGLWQPLTVIRRRPAWAAGLTAAAMAVFALGWVAGRLTSATRGDKDMVERKNGSRERDGQDEGGPPKPQIEEQENPAHEPKGDGMLVVQVQPPGTFPSTLDPPSSVEDARVALVALSRRLDELAIQAVLLDERQEITRLAELSRPTRVMARD